MKEEEAFCPSCEWTGDATGITSCPVCGTNLSTLSDLDQDSEFSDTQKYPSDLISKTKTGSEDFSQDA